ncbi:hypothetical protein [Corynebacterium sp. c7Ub_26]
MFCVVVGAHHPAVHRSLSSGLQVSWPLAALWMSIVRIPACWLDAVMLLLSVSSALLMKGMKRGIGLLAWGVAGQMWSPGALSGW